jgi:hypothetical protein
MNLVRMGVDFCIQLTGQCGDACILTRTIANTFLQPNQNTRHWSTGANLSYDVYVGDTCTPYMPERRGKYSLWVGERIIFFPSHEPLPRNLAPIEKSMKFMNPHVDIISQREQKLLPLLKEDLGQSLCNK